MLVTSIISFSHNVFKGFLPQGHLKLGLCGKELNNDSCICINKLLPNDKILDWSKLKQIADSILKCI